MSMRQKWLTARESRLARLDDEIASVGAAYGRLLDADEKAGGEDEQLQRECDATESDLNRLLAERDAVASETYESFQADIAWERWKSQREDGENEG